MAVNSEQLSGGLVGDLNPPLRVSPLQRLRQRHLLYAGVPHRPCLRHAARSPLASPLGRREKTTVAHHQRLRSNWWET
ncbi:MAG: hypothetical protein KME30_16060 [Iphinoe sp. HA4291-MV1]|nr:hypothetical protein [Iphinoe sp. HA4291-MV1]